MSNQNCINMSSSVFMYSIPVNAFRATTAIIMHVRVYIFITEPEAFHSIRLSRDIFPRNVTQLTYVKSTYMFIVSFVHNKSSQTQFQYVYSVYVQEKPMLEKCGYFHQYITR